MRERPRGAKVAPRAPDRIRESGRRQGAAGVGVREARREGSLQIRYSREGSVSRVRQRLELCARRVGEGRSGILEDDPPDLIGEKVNRIVEELLSAAPERVRFSVGAHSGRSLAVPPNG